MNIWKKSDRFLRVTSWCVVGIQMLYVVLRVVLRFCTSPETIAGIDRYMGWIMPVLVAGAVGYITNWLALWYLFKPYEPHFGGRIQGIIPRQKKEMAVSIGRAVGTKLLDPNAIVDEIQDEVGNFIKDSSRMEKVRNWIQKYLLDHETEIVEFVTPYVEREIVDVFDSLATDETWGKIWDESILPRIRNEDTRKFIVDKFVGALKDNADGIIQEVRVELRAFLLTKFSRKFFIGMWALPITNYVMENFADYESMKAKLDKWLSSDATQSMLREKMLEYADQLTTWMKGDEGRKVMAGIIREMKVRGKRFLSTYIRSKFPEFVDQAFASDLLRDKLEHAVLPVVGAKLVNLIGENKELILEKLRLEERVTTAVNEMRMEDFHRMMNDFMAENICAVQVLGFILGMLAGILLLVPRFVR
jgi:uncharacterized membrane protein YheB (UPF0754 family)